MSADTSAARHWSVRALDVSRIAAIVAMVGVPLSTALASTAIGVFVLALLASGRAVEVARNAFRQPLGKAILVFFLVAMLGTLHGPAPLAERWDSVWSWRKLLYAYLLLGMFGAEVWKDRFVKTLAAAAMLGAVASFMAWFGWIPSKPSALYVGVLFQNHTTQGMFFVLGFMACAQLWIHASGRWRWVLACAMVVLVLNLLFASPGRSAYLALAAVAFTLGWQRFGVRRVPLVAAGVVALCLAAYAVSPVVRRGVDLAVHEALHADQSAELTSVGFRAVVYRHTLELISARPVLGYGTGSFRSVYSPVVAQRYTDWRGQPTSDPHNQYMFIAMETGVVGLLAFGAILATGLACVRRGTTHAWIAAGALLGWVLSSLFNTHFRTFPEGHMIALVLGSMLASGSDLRRSLFCK
jgi:O-antigen ligase